MRSGRSRLRAGSGGALALAAAFVLFVSALASAAAQRPGLVSIVVLEADGRMLPVEQFRAEVRPGCPADGTQPPRPHFRTRTGGPAIALDGTEVRDPAPAGCGFGIVETGSAESARLRTTDVPATLVEAWSARTGILVVIVGTPVPVPTQAPAPATVPELTLGIRIAMIVGLALVAGLLTAAIVAFRGRNHGGGGHTPSVPGTRDAHHAGMFAPPPPEARTETVPAIPLEPAVREPGPVDDVGDVDDAGDRDRAGDDDEARATRP